MTLLPPEVRVRFAPSPTGPLHIGGARTALYNYLFARQNGGRMILRIEDTDQGRFVPGAEKYIIDSLAWLGIVADEGQGIGGPNEPYRQSERKEIYREFAERLVAEDKAYYSFDTTEEIDAMRQRLEKAGVTPQYNAVTRWQMKNSLTLSKEEVKEKISRGEAYAIRIKVDPKQEVRFNDLIRGWVKVRSNQIDDKVLLKSDGMPTYHLANIVDDHLMRITHVIRGEEWLPSAPLHVLLYSALGWQESMPQFAHLPLLLKPDGNGKLSKRDADIGGFPIFPLEWTDPKTGERAKGFKEEGYLPEATNNFLAFLGWNPGTEKELYSMRELVKDFSLERVHKSGAKFDINKARWFNEQYIKYLPKEYILKEISPLLRRDNASLSDEVIGKIAALMQGRVSFLKDIEAESEFLFHAPHHYDEAVVAKKWNAESSNSLIIIQNLITNYSGDFSSENVKDFLTSGLEKQGIKPGKVMQVLRLALSGLGAGPDLWLIMEILGKPETLRRISLAHDKLSA